MQIETQRRGERMRQRLALEKQRGVAVDGAAVVRG